MIKEACIRLYYACIKISRISFPNIKYVEFNTENIFFFFFTSETNELKLVDVTLTLVRQLVLRPVDLFSTECMHAMQPSLAQKHISSSLTCGR